MNIPTKFQVGTIAHCQLQLCLFCCCNLAWPSNHDICELGHCICPLLRDQPLHQIWHADVELRAQADASMPASNNNVNYTIYSNF